MMKSVMMKSGEYDDQASTGELMLDAAEPLRWFDGERGIRDELASRFETDVTPTLLFLGPDGPEVAPRIRGIGPPEPFGFNGDRAIGTARGRMGAK